MKNIFNSLKSIRWISGLLFLIAMILITGMANPDFLSYKNIISCFNASVVFTLLAIGISFVIMTGEIDVSIGATMGLTASIAGMIAQQDGSPIKMLLIAVAIGIAVDDLERLEVLFIIEGFLIGGIPHAACREHV